ncbi:50S ribosomal protein L24 [Methanobrevibacter filiformis]|uniref:Large ribosomal subunit protein uL24 n=1 Tax=Methanobrevibacter filiformis TaxID=55758 RepID=A0A165ZHI6_9EURY|nr:50S ribosomal protein L24 [Methanobrevibacter filiformis]KZX10733.1 50S ribosomal protein L24 [Methanobrevibacter filiformis]
MSKQPRKQRKFLYTAPKHTRRKMMGVSLSEKLREDYGRRSLPIKIGDTVEIVRGDFKDTKGKVESIDSKNYKVYIEGVTINKVDSTPVFVPIHPSNLVLIEADMKDDMRYKLIERKE